MPTVLNDNRRAAAMTVAEADELFGRIAAGEIEAHRVAAQFEKRLAAIKADAEATLGPIKERIKVRAALLAEYIKDHPDRFIKPRNRKTSFGTYGVRAVSNVEITDADELLADLKSKGLAACYEVSERIVKAAVNRELEAGVELAGAELRTGIRAEYKVEKKLLEAAME